MEISVMEILRFVVFVADCSCRQKQTSAVSGTARGSLLLLLLPGCEHNTISARRVRLDILLGHNLGVILGLLFSPLCPFFAHFLECHFVGTEPTLF